MCDEGGGTSADVDGAKHLAIATVSSRFVGSTHSLVASAKRSARAKAMVGGITAAAEAGIGNEWVRGT